MKNVLIILLSIISIYSKSASCLTLSAPFQIEITTPAQSNICDNTELPDQNCHCSPPAKFLVPSTSYLLIKEVSRAGTADGSTDSPAVIVVKTTAGRRTVRHTYIQYSQVFYGGFPTIPSANYTGQSYAWAAPGTEVKIMTCNNGAGGGGTRNRISITGDLMK